MALTVATAFSEFSAKITPTPVQQLLINQRRVTTSGYLKDLFASSNMPLLEARVIGSAARNTILRPLDDVDIFAVFDDSQVWPSYQFDASKLLYRVRDALNAYRVEVGSRQQAVHLFYQQPPHVEVVPAFSVVGGGYYIPGVKTYVGQQWMQTDPFVHQTFINDRNTALGGHLKPLIRLLKSWNQAHSRRVGSFHLEMIAQASFARLGYMPESVSMFFEWGQQNISVADPAGYTGSFIGSDYGKLLAIQSAFRSGRERTLRALSAEARGDQANAIALWRWIFGSEFPSYG